jgi:hypothetical protein
MVLHSGTPDCLGDPFHVGFLSIHWYSTLSVNAPATLSSASGELGDVLHCPNGLGNPCETSSLFEITYSRWDPTNGILGSYEVILLSGTRRGSFEALWCDRDVLCG